MQHRTTEIQGDFGLHASFDSLHSSSTTLSATPVPTFHQEGTRFQSANLGPAKAAPSVCSRSTADVRLEQSATAELERQLATITDQLVGSTSDTQSQDAPEAYQNLTWPPKQRNSAEIGLSDGDASHCASQGSSQVLNSPQPRSSDQRKVDVLERFLVDRQRRSAPPVNTSPDPHHTAEQSPQVIPAEVKTSREPITQQWLLSPSSSHSKTQASTTAREVAHAGEKSEDHCLPPGSSGRSSSSSELESASAEEDVDAEKATQHFMDGAPCK